jgi:hypothetical protein
VYDLQGDPAGLFKELNKKPLNSADRATQQEKILRDKGYSGYFVRHPKLGDVASIFDPLRKGFTHTVRIVAPVAPTVPAAQGIMDYISGDAPLVQQPAGAI